MRRKRRVNWMVPPRPSYAAASHGPPRTPISQPARRRVRDRRAAGRCLRDTTGVSRRTGQCGRSDPVRRRVAVPPARHTVRQRARRRPGGRDRHRRRVWCPRRGGRCRPDGDGHRHRRRRFCRGVPGRCRAVPRRRRRTGIGPDKPAPTPRWFGCPTTARRGSGLPRRPISSSMWLGRSFPRRRRRRSLRRDCASTTGRHPRVGRAGTGRDDHGRVARGSRARRSRVWR